MSKYLRPICLPALCYLFQVKSGDENHEGRAWQCHVWCGPYIRSPGRCCFQLFVLIRQMLPPCAGSPSQLPSWWQWLKVCSSLPFPLSFVLPVPGSDRSGRQKGNSVHYSQKESCWINGDGQAWESLGGYSFSQLSSTLPPALLPIGWPYGPTAVLGLLPDA